MNRPLRGMSAEDHDRILRDNLLNRHDQWCTELRNATLDALSGPDLVAARRSFAHAAGFRVGAWYDAKEKLQQFGQIHAWAVSGREGLPKRYQSEGQQIVDSFMRGVPWRAWCPWRGDWDPCRDCESEFRNPYIHKTHTCVRSDGVES